MSDVPEDLKAITPYLKRAEELDERDPVMAYYCTPLDGGGHAPTRPCARGLTVSPAWPLLCAGLAASQAGTMR